MVESRSNWTFQPLIALPVLLVMVAVSVKVLPELLVFLMVTEAGVGPPPPPPWLSVARVKSANSAVVVFVGLQDRSCPPWKVEKNTPDTGEAKVCLVVQTLWPSLQMVTSPLVML